MSLCFVETLTSMARSLVPRTSLVMALPISSSREEAKPSISMSNAWKGMGSPTSQVLPAGL